MLTGGNPNNLFSTSTAKVYLRLSLCLTGFDAHGYDFLPNYYSAAFGNAPTQTYRLLNIS